jgi:competence protein ComEC
LFVLWAFTLLAGAVPSISRAAVMFSFIVIGEAFGKRTNTYNNLAASAFFLLVYNPFYLWDAGFILSYTAVLSIVAFYKPVHDWFYIKNKLLEKIWEATAVTISAQVLTMPVILFYFHQFANLFIIANFIAVPLSGIILYGELVLLLFTFIAPLAKWAGIAVSLMLKVLDGFIEYINRLPFALWNNIYADVPQTLLLYGCIIAAAVWLIRRSTGACIAALSFLAVLVIYSGISVLSGSKTQKLIVYNVPKQTAIDIIQGHRYRFIGDSALLADGPPQRYNLKPSRIMYGVSASNDTSLSYAVRNVCINVHHTKILLLDNTFSIAATAGKIPVDVIILSKSTKIPLGTIQAAFSFRQLVFDSSNPMWKIRRWKKDCDSLHLRFYSVPEQGAFEMNL